MCFNFYTRLNIEKILAKQVQYWAGLCASLTFMFTGASMSWPSPAIPKYMNGEVDIEITMDQLSWVVSLLLVGALAGCLVSQHLMTRLGPRRTLFATAVPGLCGALIIMFAKTPELLYVARILEGMSTGMIAVVTMIYITEIADKEARGALGMLVQVMNNLGGLLVYGIGPYVSYTFLNSMVLAVPLVYVIACLWIPETPYFLLKEGKLVEARKVFMKLNGSRDEVWANEQLSVIRSHINESMENRTSIWELFTNVRYRKAVYIIAGLKVLQYMTGAIAIQSYLQLLFREGRSQLYSAAQVSIVYGLVQLKAGIAATFLAGVFGARFLMIISSLGVGVSMTLIGIYFYCQQHLELGYETMNMISFLPITGVMGFIIMYAIGIGNLPYVMQAELFPVNVKAAASSAATMSACVFSFIVAKSFLAVTKIFGLYTNFWFFAIVAYLGVFFIYFFVPETKGKTLEQVQDDLQLYNLGETEALRKNDDRSEKVNDDKS